MAVIRQNMKSTSCCNL